ncbi:MAG: hypothetical protein H0W87_02395 [Actinobacteria bacterium]|nr:hypothetical protein [Actinomycetota bacterium]
MRAGVVAALVGAAAALVLAVPASASHHPPNSVPGRVTVTLSRTDAATLVFQYTVTPPPCPNVETGCYANYGKPYGIDIYVDAAGGTTDGAVGLPTLVSPPANCNSATRPVVLCDTNKRNTDDPSTVLPLTGSFTVKGKWKKNATAEIVAEGFSLNTYQEGVAVPPPDCSQLQGAFAHAYQKLGDADSAYRQSLHHLAEIENAALIRFRIGELYVHLRNRAVEDFDASELALAQARAAAEKAHKALEDCEGVRKTGPSTSVRGADCTEKEWAPLLARGQKINLRNFAPLVRKIHAERKQNKKAQAARDVKRLRALLKTEVKALKGLVKAVDACK